ncbi:MAG TPA: aldolase/citrate lyase family protein [Myxococcota bacterium]
MNTLEKQMVDLLLHLKEHHNVVGVKAEFEAEGTRLEEAMRLKEVSMKAGLHLTLKIGGCEAIRDMFEASNLGTANLVAPMVETAYALKKYLGAIKVGFAEDQRADMNFLINLETITAFQNFDAMLALPEAKALNGIVIGRVDLTGSLGLNRDDVNGEQIHKLALDAAAKAKAAGKMVVVGGGVSFHSLAFFKGFPAGHLDRYETRKVVFQCPGALQNAEAAFLRAVEFELMWLKNKRNYYTQISREDEARLVMMEERYRRQIMTLTAQKD